MVSIMSQEIKVVTPCTNHVLLPTNDGFQIEQVANIQFCSANAMYSMIHFADGSTIALAKPLKALEEILPRKIFLRTHKSFLVNIGHIRKFCKSEATLTLSSGVKIPVSARKAAKLYLEIRNVLMLS
jgi:two-component system, LytTR family, response regulator